MAPVALGAGGTGGNTDACILQNVDTVLGRNSRNGQGENVGRFVGAVDDHPGESGKFFHKAAEQRFFAGDIFTEGSAAGCAGGGKGGDSGGGFGAAS